MKTTSANRQDCSAATRNAGGFPDGGGTALGFIGHGFPDIANLRGLECDGGDAFPDRIERRAAEYSWRTVSRWVQHQ